MVRPIQLSILSDSRLFGEAVSSWLDREEEIHVAAVADTVNDLLMRVPGRAIDVLLVYSSIGSSLPAEVFWDLNTLLPATRIILAGCEDRDSETARWLEVGVTASLAHDTSYASLLAAIQAVSEGRTICSAEILPHIAQRISQLEKANGTSQTRETERLSDREAEVAELVALGFVNKQIARRLGIKQSTAKTHVHNVLTKLQVKQRRDVMPRIPEGGTFEDG